MRASLGLAGQVNGTNLDENPSLGGVPAYIRGALRTTLPTSLVPLCQPEGNGPACTNFRGPMSGLRSVHCEWDLVFSTLAFSVQSFHELEAHPSIPLFCSID